MSLVARLVGHAIATDVAVIGPDGVAGGAGTYGAIFARARSLSAVLRGNLPSLDGAPVAFLADPSRTYVDALLAILIAGGTAVPLSPLHPASELAFLVHDASPIALMATTELASRLTPLRDGRRLVLLDHKTNTAHFPDAEATAGSPALMLYTSGTTGRPKGVVLSHGAIGATLSSLEQAWHWQRRDRLLHALPLHHTHGVVVALLGALWAGATAQLVPFDAATVWNLFADSTVFMGVPTMYAKLITAYDAADEALKRNWSDGASPRLYESSASVTEAPSP
ncbi:MAG: hypothetical protein NVS3B20_24150 [Polyangiales bacterium]